MINQRKDIVLAELRRVLESIPGVDDIQSNNRYGFYFSLTRASGILKYLSPIEVGFNSVDDMRFYISHELNESLYDRAWSERENAELLNKPDGKIVWAAFRRLTIHLPSTEYSEET